MLAGRRILVTGAGSGIGLTIARGLQYFGFGHDRAPLPGTATIHIDRDRRGATRAEVEN